MRPSMTARTLARIARFVQRLVEPLFGLIPRATEMVGCPPTWGQRAALLEERHAGLQGVRERRRRAEDGEGRRQEEEAVRGLRRARGGGGRHRRGERGGGSEHDGIQGPAVAALTACTCCSRSCWS